MRGYSNKITHNQNLHVGVNKIKFLRQRHDTTSRRQPLHGFTLIELLVVISIIALLLSILMPSLRRAKNQAKAVVCMSNLHHWGLAWSLYAQENNGRYFGYNMFWGPLRPYYEDLQEMLLCPMTGARNWDNGGYVGDPFSAWEYGGTYGNYGMNAYFHNPEIGIIGGHGGLANHWRSPHPKGVANIPLFLDANWVDGWPEPTDRPDVYHAGNDGIFPVQLFFLLTTYNLSCILFIGHKMLSD